MKVHISDTRVFEDSRHALNFLKADMKELFEKLIAEVRSNENIFEEAEAEMLKRHAYYKGLEIAATAGISAAAVGALTLTVAGIGVISLITLTELDAALDSTLTQFRHLRAQLEVAKRGLQECLDKYDNYLSLEVPKKIENIKQFEHYINLYLESR